MAPFGRHRTSAFHRMRRIGWRLGVDARRMSETFYGRLAGHLDRLGVDLVIDGGANTGQYASRLRARGYRGRIASIEPVPSVHAELDRASSADPLWTTHRFALGDEDGTATLHVSPNQGLSSSLLPMLGLHVDALPGSGPATGLEVPQRRAVSAWAELGGEDSRAPMLKLDLQGAEGRALDGASGVIDRLVAVQVEISSAPLFDGAPSGSEMLARMDGLGFRLIELDGPVRDTRTGEVLQWDALFTRAV